MTYLLRSALLGAAAFCAAASLSQATVYFRNTGSTSGWDGSNLDANCSLANVTSPAYKGGNAFKAQTNYNSSYGGRYHAMKTKNSVYRLGNSGYYGFAFHLSSNWDFTGTQQYQLFQFIANFSGSGCDGWQPSTMIWISGNQLATRRNYGSGPCNRTTQTFSGLATVNRGVWNRIILQAKWAADSTGYLRLWFNGTKVLDRTNLATTINSTAAYRMDVGLYANSWYDQKRLVGSGTRIAYFDQISVASTYAEADPAAW